MNNLGTFDATNIPPEQGIGAHPPGMFDATISNTEVKPNKDNTGGYLEVEFTTAAGRIINRYNLWNQSQQAVEIANKQLSALCHATGTFRLDFNNKAAALRGLPLRIEVAPQKNDPQYVEVKKVFDKHGNEPGRAPMGAPAQQQPMQQPQQQPQQQAPMQQQPGGGWGNPQPNPAPQQQPQGQPQGQPAWGNPQPQQQQQPQQGFTAPAGQNPAQQNAPGQMPNAGQAAMPGQPAQGQWQQNQQQPNGGAPANQPPWANR